MKKKNIQLKVALTAIGLSVIAAPASAQSALEEIIVTAQKRSQSVQDVPISIQVVSGADIQKAGAVDFETLSDSLPNVDISTVPGIKKITVRGLGSGAGSPSFEQSVGLYLDGIYASRVDLFQDPFLDIERIEVLKGPQGVLLGKNSIAGALAIHSAKPTDTFEGYVTGGYEFEHESYQGTAVISGPLSDTVSGRLAIKQSSIGAYLDNGSTGPDAGETESTNVRASLTWNVSDTTEIYLKAESSDFEDIGSPYQIEADFSAGTVPSLYRAGGPGAVLPANSGANPLTVPIFFGSLAGGEDFVLDNTTYTNDFTGVDQESENFTFQVSHDIGEHELVYLFGYAGFDRLSINDNDFSASSTLSIEDGREFSQTSHELRIVSPKGNAIEYIAGLYYLDRDFDRANSTHAFGNFIPPAFPVDISATSLGNYSEESTSLAAFGQLTWNISDSVRASVGGRYSEEDKTASNGETRFDYRTTTELATGTPAQQFKDFLLTNVFRFGPGTWSYQRSIKEDSFDPSVNVQWDVNDDTMAYASWTKATKAGGFDASEGVNNPDAFIYDPEEATGIELGVKMELLDGRARLNAAIFHTEFEDLQVSSFDPTANGGNGAFVTSNAGKATSQGIEIDGLFAVSDKLTVGGSVAFLKAEYDEFFTGCAINHVEAAKLNCVQIGTAVVQDLAGFQLENAPEFTGTLFAEYMTNIGSMYAGARLAANHKSETTLDPSQDSNLIEDAYTKVNLNFTLAEADDRWSVSLGVFNLTDEQPTTFGGQAFLLPGAYFKNRSRGREIKATATYRF